LSVPSAWTVWLTVPPISPMINVSTSSPIGINVSVTNAGSVAFRVEGLELLNGFTEFILYSA
jgi:hypothetical protein